MGEILQVMYGMPIYKWETGRGKNTAGNVWDAYIQMGDWTWEKYCRRLDVGEILQVMYGMLIYKWETGRGRNTADNVWDAYIQMGDWRWEKCCRLMDEGIECSITNAEQFGCPQSLYDFLRYSSYIRLPTECQKPNTTNYKWLQLYTELPTTLNSTDELTADTGPNSSTAINVSFFLVVVGALLNTRLY
ncbi:Hypothetical predicted protein [Mytilus galloprovincialis]|uniref:Uncharacterized protein n=1 Tax=Mytilus galloprovincialis TaxID=29158 RepID=A0A8B6EII5_MYTGA|nr:Hypothetical predicted protein [Mytilus galloprovincialis]